MKKIVVMVDRSAGNKSVGQMWTETYILDETQLISEILEVCQITSRSGQFENTVRIQIADEG